MDYVRERFENLCRENGLPKSGNSDKEISTDGVVVKSRIFKEGGPELKFMDDLFASLYSKLSDGDEILGIRMSKLVRDKDPTVRLIATVRTGGKQQ